MKTILEQTLPSEACKACGEPLSEIQKRYHYCGRGNDERQKIQSETATELALAAAARAGLSEHLTAIYQRIQRAANQMMFNTDLHVGGLELGLVQAICHDLQEAGYLIKDSGCVIRVWWQAQGAKRGTD